MSNLVKQSQLSEVALELWRRIKNRYNGAFINARYEEVTQKLILTPVEGAEVEVSLSDLASKTLDNIFTGKNTFKDINLESPIQINANQSVQGGSWTNAYYEVKTGSRELTSHSQNSNGYVRNLVVRVGNINLGDKVNVNVWEVKKGQDRSGDTPTQLHSNLELTTVEPAGYFNGGVAVKIPINKKYTDVTYFIYQVVGTAARIFRVSGATESEDYIFLLDNDDVTRDNIVTSPKDSVGAHILELGDVSIGDLLDSITSEAVTSVNNIKPVDGNVTVDALNIDYNNQTSGILASNVQDAIDRLKDDITLLDTSDIHIVQDNTQLNDLLTNQNKVKHGDLIYIIDSDNVIDHTGITVGSLDNPIAMIYDIGLPDTGNRLRVFSKFSSSINLSADVVTYNDNNTNLTAGNVQEAIEKLNNKVDTKVTSVEFDGVDKLNVVTNGQSVSQDLSPLLGIKTINGQVGTSGAINLSTNDIANGMEFKVENQVFATLDFMTEQDANDIINSFTF